MLERATEISRPNRVPDIDKTYEVFDTMDHMFPTNHRLYSRILIYLFENQTNKCSRKNKTSVFLRTNMDTLMNNLKTVFCLLTLN